MRRLCPSPRSPVLAVLLRPAPTPAADDYVLGPDSSRHDGVPKGKVTQFTAGRARSSTAPSATTGSTSPPSTTREDAGLRHGLSGRRRLRRTTKGQFRVPIVFDNLIHKKEMPVTIGIFINPGDVPGRAGKDRRPRSQPQLRVRHALRPVRHASWRRRSCRRWRRRYKLRDRRGRPGDLRHQFRRHLRLHRRPGSGRTCSARCSATSAASPTSAAATSIRA